MENIPTLNSERIKLRLEQSRASRLAEYITGKSLEDPQLIDRLTEDHKRIRAKYNLPDRRSITYNPSEYERFLRNIAQSIGVEIKEQSECGTYFEEAFGVNAVYFSDTKNIGLDIDKQTREAYMVSLNSLEHEVIHALQGSNDLNTMPIELMEYEAYIAGGNMQALKESPEVAEVLFSFLIGGSVQLWYSDMNKSKGLKIEPEWNKADYFLKKDGFSDDEIKKILETEKKVSKVA